MKNSQMPCAKSIDSSIMLYLDGYNFIQKRCNEFESDVFQMYLLGKKVICMSGADAAKVFYNNRYFKRKGAAPIMIQKSLFGKHGVQGLDGAEHKNRKLMFMTIMSPQNMELLQKITLNKWKTYSKKWEQKDSIILFDEVQELLTEIACLWAGIPLKADEIKSRANDFGKMIDAFGTIGPRNWQGICARKKTEKWAREKIIQIRLNKLIPYNNSPANGIAWHSDINGQLLSTQIAAVELINILRPIVAIATYITFGALALYMYPENLKKLQSDDEEYSFMFAQEVRRYYPFAPFVGAIVKKTFTWRNCGFKKGTLVLFDIYGTNHDSRLWEKPNEFNPERFRNRKEDLFDFVPQGGGDQYKGHRCAGELVTINILKDSIDFLVKGLEYKVPGQCLNYSLRRMPTLPKSRFIINKIKKK